MHVLLRGPPVALLMAALCACADDPVSVDAGPIALTIVSGDQQVWIAGHELPDALVVKVTKKQGQGVPNHLVNFRVVEGGGSVFAGAALTNPHGIAQDYWTLGPEPGENVLEVRSVDPTTGEKQVYARFAATAFPFPDELTTIRNLLSDAFVRALADRLDPTIASQLRSAFDVVVEGLGDELDFDAVEIALSTAHVLVTDGGPPNLVEFAFLDLVLSHAVTLFDQAILIIFG